MGPGLVGGPGTCVCAPGFFGTPLFVGADWTNPCLATAVKIATSLTLTGTTAAIMNTPTKKAAFAQGESVPPTVVGPCTSFHAHDYRTTSNGFHLPATVAN